MYRTWFVLDTITVLPGSSGVGFQTEQSFVLYRVGLDISVSEDSGHCALS